jgi:hypothetical protein
VRQVDPTAAHSEAHTPPVDDEDALAAWLLVEPVPLVLGAEAVLLATAEEGAPLLEDNAPAVLVVLELGFPELDPLLLATPLPELDEACADAASPEDAPVLTDMGRRQ